VRRQEIPLSQLVEQLIWALDDRGQEAPVQHRRVPGRRTARTSSRTASGAPAAIELLDAGNRTEGSAALVDAIAHRVVELLGEPAVAVNTRRLVSASELAVELGVSRSFVYAHAEELGAIALGAGSKPRLRFDVERVKSAGVCSTSGRSQPDNACPDNGSLPVVHRARHRLPTGLPKPGSVLQIRGEERTA
jgi:hypothetical protein